MSKFCIGVTLTGIGNIFENELDSYLKDKYIYYKKNERAQALIQSISSLSDVEKNQAIINLKVYLESDKYDFYLNSLLIITLYKLGKIREVRTRFNSIALYLVKTKKLHKLKELILILQETKVIINELKTFERIYDLRIGNVESIGSEKTILSFLEFNDVKMNSSVYFKNTFVLKQFVESIEIYPVLDIIEAILKAVPIIPIDNHFIKSLEKISYESGSIAVSKSIVDVVSKLGQSFGVNIDKLNNVTRPKDTEDKGTTSSYEYRIPIQIEQNKILDSIKDKDLITMAIAARNNKDFLLAIALYREVLFEQSLDEESYLNCVYEIAMCYESRGDLDRANKLYSFICMYRPSYRRAKERLSNFEQN